MTCGSFTRSSRPSAAAASLSIRRRSDSRVRIDAGTLFDMRCLPVRAGIHRLCVVFTSTGCTPPNFQQI